jgi:hypothetical protein
MSSGYQVMSRATGHTYGVFHGETPEAALDEWAAVYRWGSWRKAQEKAPDLFGKSFSLEEGFRIYL